VTAEFAVVLPAVVLVLLAAIGGVQVAGEQLRLQSGVANAARLIGRGQGGAAAVLTEAVSGAELTQSRHGSLVCALGRVRAGSSVLPGIELHATVCAWDDAE
jgi:hypothetical protein